MVACKESNIRAGKKDKKKNRPRGIWHRPRRDFCIHKVPECLFLRRNWKPPTPSPASECMDPKGEQHLLAGEGVGGPNSDDWTESLALCILCGAAKKI
jgi:hypothetical protein